MQPTTLSGTVFAPNGTLPLYGVSVYVSARDPGPFTPGVTCSSCAAGLPGDPIAQTTTKWATFRSRTFPAAPTSPS